MERAISAKSAMHYITLAIMMILSLVGCGVEDSPKARDVIVEGEIIGDSSKQVFEVYDTLFDYSTDVDSNSDNGISLFTLYTVAGPEREIEFQSETGALGRIVLPSLDQGKYYKASVALVPESSDQSKASFSLISFNELDDSVEPTPSTESTISPSPVVTNQPNTTPDPLKPTSVPTVTVPINTSPFDSQGNTTSFGIPQGLTGNISQGRQSFESRCAGCHGELGSGWRFGRLKTRIAEAPMFIKMPDRELSHIVAFLNRGAR